MASGLRQKGREATILIVINSHSDSVNLKLPESPSGNGWSLVIDTDFEDEQEEMSFAPGTEYNATSHSLLLFVKTVGEE